MLLTQRRVVTVLGVVLAVVVVFAVEVEVPVEVMAIMPPNCTYG